MAYSQDLRDRVLAAYDRGMKSKQIADVFQVSRSWARRVKQRRRETGETSARRAGSPGVVRVDRVELERLVREHPDATLVQLRERLGVRCALSTISAALRGMGFTFKKKVSAPRSRIARTWRRGERIGGAGPGGVMRGGGTCHRC
jgi:transposase